MEGEDTVSELGIGSEWAQTGQRLISTERFQRQNPSSLRDLLDDLRKKRLILGLSEEWLVLVAYDRSAEPASTFIVSRTQTNNVGGVNECASKAIH